MFKMKSNLVLLYICLGLILISKCYSKGSLKRLTAQLRVFKESHILDMKEMHEEIDSLTERLNQVESFINDTQSGTIRTDHSETGIGETKYQTDLVRDFVGGLDKLEIVEKSFVEYAERLRNGFKSLKTWNKQSLKELALKLEDRLGNQRTYLLSRIDRTHEQVGAFTKDIIELQTKSALSEDKIAQGLEEIKDSFTSEVRKQEASADAKFNGIQLELGKIKNHRPTYWNKLMKTEWQVIFKAHAENGASVYEAWVNGKSTTTTLPVENNRHYRNPAINSWNNLGVKYVHLGLYASDGTEVAFILFDGVRSDKMNWFSKHRILDSSWAQLRYDSSLNHASIRGDGRQKVFYECTLWRVPKRPWIYVCA